MHGKLGEYPLFVETLPSLPNDFESHRTNNINVVSDRGIESSKEFTEAKDALWKAHKYFILGFGYGEQNVQRLNLVEYFREDKEEFINKRIFSTCKKLNTDTVKALNERFNGKIIFADESFGCELALRSWAESL